MTLRRFRSQPLHALVTAAVGWLVPLVVRAQIENPIGCQTIQECLGSVLQWVLGLVGVLALAGIVYGGFLYITSGGNQDRIEQGKHAVYYSVIGLLVVGLAYAVVAFIFGALSGSAPGFGGAPGPGGAPGFGGAPGGGGAPGFGGTQ